MSVCDWFCKNRAAPDVVVEQVEPGSSYVIVVESDVDQASLLSLVERLDSVVGSDNYVIIQSDGPVKVFSIS